MLSALRAVGRGGASRRLRWRAALRAAMGRLRRPMRVSRNILQVSWSFDFHQEKLGSDMSSEPSFEIRVVTLKAANTRWGVARERVIASVPEPPSVFVYLLVARHSKPSHY